LLLFTKAGFLLLPLASGVGALRKRFCTLSVFRKPTSTHAFKAYSIYTHLKYLYLHVIPTTDNFGLTRLLVLRKLRHLVAQLRAQVSLICQFLLAQICDFPNISRNKVLRETK
jgi:hypothetical protein